LNHKIIRKKISLYVKEKGLFYAFFRGVKYVLYLAQYNKKIIQKGSLKAVVVDQGIKLFWNNIEVTQSTGLKVDLNVFGMKTDSSRASWSIVSKGKDYFKLQLIFKEIPLTQNWFVELGEEGVLRWQIALEAEESLSFDHILIDCLLQPRFKNWFSLIDEGHFMRISDFWRDYPINNNSSFVGVRFLVEGDNLPSVVFESQNQERDFFISVRNSPQNINSCSIGFLKGGKDRLEYSKGKHNLFSGSINFFAIESDLDKKVDRLKKSCLHQNIEESQDTFDRKMKVLLVNLPWEKEGQFGVRAGSRWPHMKDNSEGNYMPFPFFLAYATALLIKEGTEVSIVDAIASGLSKNDFLEKVNVGEYDLLVAETSIPSFVDDMAILKSLSGLVKKIVLCGPNSQIYTREFLEVNRFIDFILYGEYEFTLLDLVDKLKSDQSLSDVSGLIYRDGQKVKKNQPRELQDINILPWPQRDSLPMNKYWDLPGNIPYPSAQMVASRGCPFGCSFCLWPQVLFGGKNYRTRDTMDVVDEMEHLIKDKSFKSVYFDDDTFNVGKPRMLELCDEIIKRGLEKIPWAIMAKADLMDEEILKKMEEAGLYAVKYGVESASQELIDNGGKPLNLEKADKMIRLTKSLGINVHLTFTFGLPGETQETIDQTIDYAIDLDPHSVQFSIMTPFHGTSFFDELERRGKIWTKDLSLYDGHSSCVFNPDHVSSEDLVKAKDLAYFKWAEHKRKQRGFLGDVDRFLKYIKSHGLVYTVCKTADYLKFVWSEKKGFLRGRV